MKPLERLRASQAYDGPALALPRQAASSVRSAAMRVSASRRHLPDVILVGAQRCGTSALTSALLRLPTVVRSVRGKGSHYFSHHYGRGPDWYRSQFPLSSRVERLERRHGDPGVVLDACPYYLFHPLGIERLASDAPTAKLIVMLRHPVARAWSHYRRSVDYGFETLTFAEALDAEAGRLRGADALLRTGAVATSLSHEHHSYVAKGRYVEQMERLYGLVDRNRVMVVVSEDFYADPDQVLGQVTDWLGLRSVRLDERDDRNAHARDPMPEAIRRRLVRELEPANEGLADLLGFDPGWYW